MNTQNPHIRTTPDTDKSVTNSSLRSRVKKGFTRRLFFRRTAEATGALALAGGNATLLTACTNMAAAADPAASSHATTIASAATAQNTNGALHEYWIQADSFQHNLVPSGLDDMTNTHYPANQTTYQALGYRAYTPNWEKPLPGDATIGPNTGIPGPIIRAKVGDTVRVHFRNNDAYYKFSHSIHAHGFWYTPASNGSYVAKAGDQPGSALKPGESYTYEWKAVASSVGSWPYHDHSRPAMIAGSTGTTESGSMNVSSGNMGLGMQLGLYGMIIVTDKNTQTIDREFVVCMQDLYEADIPQLVQDFDCFNGNAFLGNTPTFTARVGEHVRWHIMALGTDFHVFHIHGHRWQYNGNYVDSVMLGPSTTVTFDYIEDNPGSWIYHCHVDDHMMGGMVGYYTTK